MGPLIHGHAEACGSASAAVPHALPLTTSTVLYLLLHPMMRQAVRTSYWGSLAGAADSVTFIVAPACPTAT
jgi:hypothetical protein